MPWTHYEATNLSNCVCFSSDTARIPKTVNYIYIYIYEGIKKSRWWKVYQENMNFYAVIQKKWFVLLYSFQTYWLDTTKVWS